ncbi:lipoprotein-releasing ABC transporter permease subunit [soil metagenome]
MNFSLFLALRYLRPKRTFVSFITLISITGVALGVTPLIVVIAVMAGFERKIKDTVLGFEPHITYETSNMGTLDADGFPVGNGWQEVASRLEGVPGITGVSPFVQGPVFMEVGNEPLATLMRAIDAESDAQFANLHAMALEGTFALEGETAVVGATLASQFNIAVGDVVTVYSPKGVKDLVNAVRDVEADPDGAESRAKLDEIRSMILPVDLKVTGIFESLHYGQFMIVPLHVGQGLYDLVDSVHGLAVVTEDAYRADQFNDRGLRVVPPDWGGMTWGQKHKQWFDTIRMERTMMYFVLSVIMLVAGFCIMVTMITVTVQKRREIGLAGALGAKVSQIVWVFLSQGMVVGVIGVAGGLAFGLLILHFRNGIREFIARTTGAEIFDAAIYGVSEIPARVMPGDLVFISSAAFLLCSVAALVPAILAAIIDPAKALRNI